MKILGICGAGGAGREVAEIASFINKKANCWDEIVFLEIEEKEPINGYRVLSETEAFLKLKACLEVVVSNGEPSIREKIFKKILKYDITLATLIHPDVNIPDTAVIGKGVVIGQMTFISCNTVIGDNCYISNSAALSHDSVLAEGCVICGNVTINGNCNIGRYAFIGSNSSIKQNIKVGNHSVIGMCAAVINDIPDSVIAAGNPARVLKENDGIRVFS